MSTRLLEVRNLKTYFVTRHEIVRAVDGVDLHIDQGETLGVIGESGSGKSVTALSIMRLVPEPPGRLVDGQILYDGRDLATVSARDMRRIRGKKISMIFQDPMTSLNPLFTCGEQIAEVLMVHERLAHREAAEKAVELLRLVRIADPDRRAKEYPHQLSGGMRQRVMIAIALACNPQLLLADEPTTALDVTIQAQILQLLNELKVRLKMTVMLITHDMGVIAETAERVLVMYAAKVAEEAPVIELFRSPMHPYTQALLRSIPRVDRTVTGRQPLQAIPGIVPTLKGEIAPGCRFAARCPHTKPICTEQEPIVKQVKPGRKVACWLYQ